MDQQSNNLINNPHQFMLTAQQVSYLASQLPKCFSIVPYLKSSKQLKDTPKIKSTKSLIIDEKKSPFKKTQVDDLNQIVPEIKRQRTSKPFTYQKEDKNIPRSVYVFEEAMTSQMKQCMKLLQQLKKHPSSWPFLEPVDPIKLEIPQYFTIIKQPIDLGTIGNNLRARYYETPTQFHADISKMFSNSYKFNAKQSDMNILTQQLQNHYNKLISQSSSSKQINQNNSNIYETNQRQSIFKKQPVKRIASSEYQEIKITKKKNEPIINLTLAQKKILGQNIRKLPKDCLRGVWQIVSQGNSTMNQLKFDIDQLSIQKVRQLERYVSSQLSKSFGSDLPKQSFNTSETMRQQKVQSEDVSSFLSQDSI